MSRVIEFPGCGRGRKAARTTASDSRRAATPRRAPRKGARDRVLSRLLHSPEGCEFLAAVAMARTRTLTAVDAVVPPGTVLDAVVRELRDATDLPPEMGLVYTIGLLSAALSQAGSTVTLPGVAAPVELAVWIILLAPSGAGKTLVRNLILRALGLDLRELPEPGSARAYLDGLAACDGRAIWLRDEFGQLIKQITNSGGPLAPLRDLLLRTYDSAKLETNTRRDGQTVVEHPVVTVIGNSVEATWSSCVDAAMLSDGLLARFLFIVSARRPLSVPLYPTQDMTEHVQAVVPTCLRERLTQPVEYHISDAAIAYYTHEWKALAEKLGSSIDAAYYRRVTWSAVRLAVIYHLLLNEAGEVIGIPAMQWAWRAVTLFMAHVRAALQLSDPTFAARLDRILAWLESDAVRGRKWSRSDLNRALFARFRRDIRSAADARQLIDLVARFTE
jgi:hypothetical protein